jgi:general secretion pathway protein D
MRSVLSDGWRAPLAVPALLLFLSHGTGVFAQTAPPSDAPPVSIVPSTPDQPSQAQTEMYPGTGAFTNGRPPRNAAASADEQGDITLNFVNSDVKDVAKAVLGDYLKLNYEIGANVQGTVTIQTSRPLKRSQVLPALEQALRLNNMAVIESHGLYKVVPLADAQHAVHVSSARHDASIGYGVDVVPVRYINAADMAKLLEPLAPASGIVHVDSTRNVLLIEGTAEERQTLRDDVALFDTDWMRGMSFALFTPEHVDADELAKELGQVLGGQNSPAASLVQLVPIQRLNAVLAISHQARYLDHVRAWVNRLDRPGEGSDKRIYVYDVQNGRASDLAATLGKLLFGNSGSAPTPGPSSGAIHQGGLSAPPPAMATAGSTMTGSVGAPADAVSISGSAPGMGSLSITADETNNALAILATPQQYGVIQAALKKLDAAPLQVLLEAAIAEVTLTDNIKYGVQYFFQPNTMNQIVLSDSASAAIAPAYPGFSYLYSSGNNIKIILDALQSITHIEVVSSPQVMVLNNQVATLQVGDRVPIVTQQAQQTTSDTAPIINSIEYEDTGVILKVTPRVNRGGMVMMDISQEVSQVADTSASPVPSPTIQERKINSSVAVQDGETVVLGGLISDARNSSKNGIPILQSIPVLGNLFRDTGYGNNRTELLVLITPRVVDNTQKARKVTDELRRKLPSVEAVLERAH